MLLQAERHRWEAEWLSARGAAAADAVRQGLAAVARARAADPKNAEAMALEATLLLIDARTRYPESAEALRAKARALLEQALRAKPNLKGDYGAMR